MRSLSRSVTLKEQPRIAIPLHQLLCAKCKVSFWYPEQPAFLRLSCGHSLCKLCRSGLVAAGEREFLCEHLPSDKGCVRLVRPETDSIETYDSSQAVITLLQREVAKIKPTKCVAHSKESMRVAFRTSGNPDQDVPAKGRWMHFLCGACSDPPESLVLSKKELEQKLLKICLDTPRFDLIVDELEKVYADKMKPIANGNDVIKALFGISRQFWQVTLPDAISEESELWVDFSEEVAIVASPKLKALEKSLNEITELVQGGAEDWERLADDLWTPIAQETGLELEYGAKRISNRSSLGGTATPQRPEGVKVTQKSDGVARSLFPTSAVGVFGNNFVDSVKRLPSATFDAIVGDPKQGGKSEVTKKLEKLENRLDKLESENRFLRGELEKKNVLITRKLETLQARIEAIESQKSETDAPKIGVSGSTSSPLSLEQRIQDEASPLSFLEIRVMALEERLGTQEKPPQIPPAKLEAQNSGLMRSIKDFWRRKEKGASTPASSEKKAEVHSSPEPKEPRESKDNSSGFRIVHTECLATKVETLETKMEELQGKVEQMTPALPIHSARKSHSAIKSSLKSLLQRIEVQSAQSLSKDEAAGSTPKTPFVAQNEAILTDIFTGMRDNSTSDFTKSEQEFAGKMLEEIQKQGFTKTFLEDCQKRLVDLEGGKSVPNPPMESPSKEETVGRSVILDRCTTDPDTPRDIQLPLNLGKVLGDLNSSKVKDILLKSNSPTAVSDTQEKLAGVSPTETDQTPALREMDSGKYAPSPGPGNPLPNHLDAHITPK